MRENRITLITRRRFQLAFYCLIGVGLSACADTRDVIRLDPSHMNAPIKILMMESPISVDPVRLRPVLAPDIKPRLPVSTELLRQGEGHAQEFALASMQAALGKQAELELITSPAQESEPFRKIQRGSFDSPITQDEADWLGTTTGADALLRFRITDYGLTPRSWRKGYITFEVASTLALAGVIASSGTTAAKAAAGGYVAQETVEETAEAYAGFGALDVVCRPVRVEAELVRLHPLATVWEASDTGLSDVNLSRLTRKVPSAERDSQLDQSTDHAVEDLVSDLSGAVRN